VVGDPMKKEDIKAHLIGPIDMDAFRYMGWHCKKCQISVFNLLSELL